jgi:hypothetical protein
MQAELKVKNFSKEINRLQITWMYETKTVFKGTFGLLRLEPVKKFVQFLDC